MEPLTLNSRPLYEAVCKAIERAPPSNTPPIRKDTKQLPGEYIRRIAVDISSGGRIPEAVKEVLSF